jgi:hypothetical protein
MEFGIGGPGELVGLLLEGFIVEMASTSGFLGPLSGENLVSGVLEHLHVDVLGGKDYKHKKEIKQIMLEWELTRQSEIAREFFLRHAWDDDEWTLGRLVEGVERCDVVVLEVRLLIPLAILYLQFPLQVLKLRRLELRDVFASLLLHRRFERVCVGHAVHRQTRDHLVSAAGLASDYLRGWRCRGAERLGNHQADRNALDSPAALLLEDDFQVGWASYVQEILRVPAPVLVLLALLVDSSAASSRGGPFALELLLDGAGELPEVDWVRGKNSEEERSLLLLLVGGVLRVWNDHVMDRLLLILGQQSACLSDFTLTESLETRRRLKHNITLADFPEPVALGFDSHNNEVHGNVRPLRNLFVLLHQTDYERRLFGDRDPELRVVEPPVIGVVLGALAILLFFDRS